MVKRVVKLSNIYTLAQSRDFTPGFHASLTRYNLQAAVIS